MNNDPESKEGADSRHLAVNFACAMYGVGSISPEQS